MGRQSRSSKAKRKSSDAEVIDLDVHRAVRLTERALDGDVDAMILWLSKYGGRPWAIQKLSRRVAGWIVRACDL